MKKIALFTAAVAGVLGSGVATAHADEVVIAGVAWLAWGPDYAYLDGYDENPGPLSGFIYVSAERACAGADGSHGHSSTEICIPA